MPLISIILPVRNERWHIEACLESIMGQQGIEQCEVLVVDGMSDDGTRELLNKKKKEYSILDVIENKQKKVTSAVNIGISKASGGIIMRMDAHALYAPDYIAACLRVMENTGAANVGGHAFALPSGDTLIANAIALAHHSPFGLGGASFRDINAEGEVETVWPGCFKKEALDKAGLLREELTRSEDIELNYRLRKAGYRIYLSPEIKLYYFCRNTLCSLASQRFLDGKGVMQTLAVNAGAVRLRHFAPLAVIAIILLVVLAGAAGMAFDNSVLSRASTMLAVFGAGLYVFLCLFFSVLSFTDIGKLNARVAERKFVNAKFKPGAAVLAPIVFPALHFSYGLGSLAGLMKK